MANNSTTLFKTDSGAGNNSLSYVQDTFNDISLPATNNTGLTSTAATNPLGAFFNDNDAPRYGYKTLYVKDLVIIDDHSLWINNKPTYRIIWSENAPFAAGYVCGSPTLNMDGKMNVTINMADPSDIAGVTSTARRAVFLIYPSITSPTTVTTNVDGVGTATYNVGGTTGGILNEKNGPRAHTVSCEAANETNNIHDFRVISTTVGAVKLIGVQLYFENAGANIECPPGNTYYNKVKVTTSTGASLALPSLGSSLGGRNLIFKSQSGSYGVSSSIIPMQQSIGVGTNGAGTISVSTGHGASFPTGTIVAGFYGSTAYIGAVTSVSTDTLSVTPTVYPASGVSGLLYKLAFGGFSAAIGTTLYQLSNTFGSSEIISTSRQNYISPKSQFAVNYDANCAGPTLFYGATNFPFTTGKYLLSLSGGSYIKCEGYFSAAEIEVTGFTSTGVGTIGGTFYINGIPAWSTVGVGITGVTKFSVFTGAGPGWNSFNWGFGGSFNNIALSKISLYTVNQPYGISYGQLAYFDNIQSFIPQDNAIIGSTFSSWGNSRRYYSYELPIVTGGASTITNNFYALRQAVPMSAGTDGFTLTFYGKNVAIGGTFAAGTTTVIDGTGIANAAIWGRTYTALTEGLHTLSVSMAAGNTTFIGNVDVSRTASGLTNLQKYADEAVKKMVTTASSSPSVPGIGKNLVIYGNNVNVNTSSTTPTDVAGLGGVFVNRNGNPTIILICPDPSFAPGSSGNYFALIPNAVDQVAYFQLNRNGISLGHFTLSQHDANEIDVPIAFNFIDPNPPIGESTYQAQFSVNNAGASAVVRGAKLVIYELP